MLMDAARASLLIVDVQERLGPVMAEPRQVYRHCALLLRAAGRLGVPVTVSEQYPKGLGRTLAELLAEAPAGVVLEKTHFSCAADAAILARVKGFQRPQLVVSGIEAHVCVLQSALGFLAQGFEVFVVADACSSRVAANHQLAMNRMAAAGVGVVSTEMVVFEWLERAGTPEFKDLSALIK